MSAIIVVLVIVLVIIFIFKVIDFIIFNDISYLNNFTDKEDSKSITIKCPNCGDIYTLQSEKEMANAGNDLVSCYKCGYKYKQKDNILYTKVK